MKISKEDFIKYVLNTSDNSLLDNPWKIVEESDWKKHEEYQVRNIILQYKSTGKYYSIAISRTKSHMLSWVYSYELSEILQLFEVVPQTKVVTTTEWVLVGSIKNSTFIEAYVEDNGTFRLKLPEGFYEEHYEDLQQALEDSYGFEWEFRGCLMYEDEYLNIVEKEENTQEERRDYLKYILLELCERKDLSKLYEALLEV